MMATPRLIDILLVEDNPTDVLMTREAFERNHIVNPLHIAEDGVAALGFLRREGSFVDAPVPGLIILDLNLPRISGREVLREIKADSQLKLIPVVILTTSKAEEDIVKSYGLHANCYITKPVDFEQFSSIVRSFRDFWFGVVTLPCVVE